MTDTILNALAFALVIAATAGLVWAFFFTEDGRTLLAFLGGLAVCIGIVMVGCWALVRVVEVLSR